MTLTTGARLGPYEILDRIGAGGMGVVWRARDTRLGRIVAIKQLIGPPGPSFTREARAIAALNHPHICTLHDVGPDYLVMEHVEGGPLRPLDTMPPPLSTIYRLGLEIAEALEAAHSQGVVHLDLKPGNILLTASGSIKLVDFGLARLRPPSVLDGMDTKVDDTSLGGFVAGTPSYMSPEQAEGKPLDARSDIFSFGIVLYELVAGRHAFSAGSVAGTLTALIRDEPPPLAAPTALARIVARCLRKAPAERFQTMSEVRTALVGASTHTGAPPPSIAVLPFTNMSSDPEQEYFSDGLSEEIINALTQVPGLKVIARTSAFAFKGRHEDVRRIAEILGVGHVVDGSVRKAGNRLRIAAQLVAAADGSHLWSERFDRDLTDIFEVQEEIALAISQALQVKLGPVPPRGRDAHVPSLAAYEALLKGRYHLMKQTPAASEHAKQCFDRAAALDPLYAEPHAALAHHYGLMSILGMRPAHEMVPLLRQEALKLQDMDPSDERALVMLGTVKGIYEYEWSEADVLFRAATATGSLRGELHAWLGASWSMPRGRYREGVERFRRGVDSDPLNVFWRSVLAELLAFSGQYEESMRELRQALDLDERQWHLHWVMAQTQTTLGHYAEALAAAERGYELAPWESRIVGLLAGLRARTGRAESAPLLRQMQEGAAMGMVMYYVVRGDFNRAAAAYEAAIAAREPLAVMYAHIPLLAPLRASSRWRRLAALMNMSPAGDVVTAARN